MCERKSQSQYGVTYWVLILFGATFHGRSRFANSNLMVQVAAFVWVSQLSQFRRFTGYFGLPSHPHPHVVTGDCQFNGYAFHGIALLDSGTNCVGLLKKP